MGCHLYDKTFHSISFYCDDIQKTTAELQARGVEFTSGISEQEWGWQTHFRMTGGIEVELYQPKYKKRAKARKK